VGRDRRRLGDGVPGFGEGLRPEHTSDAFGEELRAYVKSALAPYKYPRWIEFVRELPKTATGKIQRFKLRTAR
jgi:acyl-coenzyme A synthetase/AMP-(fatty) acid ligase